MQCNSVPVCNCIQKTTRITRFKPLFDSFQGCFKDKFRFFASMLFLCCFIVSMICAVSLNPDTLYVSIEVLIIIILCLHAWAQPYERRFYNILDAFMYTNLAIVNDCSYHPNYSIDSHLPSTHVHCCYVAPLWINPLQQECPPVFEKGE